MLRAVCKSGEIPHDGWKVFTVVNVDVLIGRRHGTLFACNNSCPHRGASLSKGEFRGDSIRCYMHGYEYNVFTGRLEKMASWKQEVTWVEQSPEWRKSGDLELYAATEKDGTIYIDLPVHQ